MGHEIIKNHLTGTPQRIFAALALIQQLGRCPQRELMELLQPQVTRTDQLYQAVADNLVIYGMADRDDSRDRELTPTAIGKSLTSIDAFRTYMQQRLLRATREEDDNFLLGLFTAWYAVQDEQVLIWNKADYEARFHTNLFPAVNERPLSNNPDLNAWQLWAEFLGWGWTLTLTERPLVNDRRNPSERRSSSERRIIPDATVRLRPLVDKVLPADGPLPFGQFVEQLSAHCPELDGGVLFERAWSATHGDETRRQSCQPHALYRVAHLGALQ